MITEYTIQKTFKDWCDKQDFILTHWHVPNGMTSNAKEGKLMKRQGLRAGVWDYWLITNKPELLVIEFKTDKGVLSDSQIEFEKYLGIVGIKHCVCRSAFEASQFVKNSLNF